jgi:asparagine synthase (glutamine-hydrolysing)
MVTDTLLDSKSISRGYFRKEAVKELIELNSRSSRYFAEIFSLVVLELWHRTFIDQQEISLSTTPMAIQARADSSQCLGASSL